MRVATWNVNSLRARLDRVEEWLADYEPDVLLMQETKCEDAGFPFDSFSSLGYEVAHHGDGRWNGVAIVSRDGLEDVQLGFSEPLQDGPNECRIMSATCGGIRVFSVYVPNGRSLDSPHYDFKLSFLAHLRRELDEKYRPGDPVIIGGDFNVAPEDRDVWDPAAFVGATHTSAKEREALANLSGWGLQDVVRQLNPTDLGLFSWWDYRAGAFHKGQGMRIDLLLCSNDLAEKVSSAVIDREGRKKGRNGGAPSDHAPVFIDLVR